MNGEALVRLTTVADFDALLAMKSDPEDVKWSGFAGPPEPTAFFGWFLAAMADPSRMMFTGLADGAVAGYVHFHRTGAETWEISTGVAAPFRGRGLANAFRRAALAEFSGSLPRATVEMWIAEGNTASQRSWSRMGFTPSRAFRQRDYGHPPRTETMRLWRMPE